MPCNRMPEQRLRNLKNCSPYEQELHSCAGLHSQREIAAEKCQPGATVSTRVVSISRDMIERNAPPRGRLIRQTSPVIGSDSGNSGHGLRFEARLARRRGSRQFVAQGQVRLWGVKEFAGRGFRG